MTMFSQHYISFFFFLSTIIPSLCQQCYTPLQSPGECINIRECKDMMEYLLTRTTPWSNNVQNFITASKCYNIGNDQRDKICCPHIFTAFDESGTYQQAKVFDTAGNEYQNIQMFVDNLNTQLPQGNLIYNPYPANIANSPVHSTFINQGTGVQYSTPLIRLGTLHFQETIPPNYGSVEHKKTSHIDKDQQQVNNSNIKPQNYAVNKGAGNHKASGGPIKNDFKRNNTERPRQNIMNLLPEMCGRLEANRYQSGNTIGIFDFPWMALLVYSDDPSLGLRYECGGTIISARYILTAASCLKPSLIGVRVGEHDTKTEEDCQGIGSKMSCSSGYQDLLIKGQITHSSYKGSNRLPSVQNDIGLIKLEKAIVFKANAQPICLPKSRTLKNIKMIDKVLVVAGWGATENGIEREKPIKSNITTTSKSDCEKLLNRLPTDTTVPKQLCARGVVGMESCAGDSGGALMLEVKKRPRFVQYGVLGTGVSRCGATGMPGLYANVVYYMNWILKTMAK